MAEKEKAAPKFVGGPPRSEVVKLDYPVEFDGKLWTEITVRRMTAAEVSDWASRARAADDATDIRFPMFDAPNEVMDGLDVDDDERVQEVASRFLPRRFRVPAESKEHGPESGGSGASRQSDSSE